MTDAPTPSGNITQEFVYAVGGVGIAFAIIKVCIILLYDRIYLWVKDLGTSHFRDCRKKV